MLATPILRLNQFGQPVAWLAWQEAVGLYARGIVSWTIGEPIGRVYGGYNRFSGQRSCIELPSILACKGEYFPQQKFAPCLNNQTLFERDNFRCLYCGNMFSKKMLTRDHVVPRSQGGKDIWENVVAACRRCNQRKGDSLLERSNMQLLALPYRPNHAEYLALLNSRRILPNQVDFLSKQFSSNWRINDVVVQ